ncbi:YbgA family protein [Liquorilactobacillus hordei]|uniref:DUF1722 domain-containing protein n=1 Tax=Liquorilactobacillus hordei DSM 19519 TaxID=1423759 RepID=A0A0R1MH70_9LACO|nr:YbgA family protein [Liquorilactobacillus hordei]KRL07270.1 hypothetical protein FC92_GL002048 [Liquorilactobacillus hordei DSM 19519]QYH52931.1 YbgA family protein [Liquorilactobacillus hordei DSM 19519]
MEKWQVSWAQNKYWVMSRSQQYYNEIRVLAKENHWDEECQQRYEQILQEIDDMMPTRKTLTTAYQHVWGYFKKQATLEEKQNYQILLKKLEEKNDELGRYLVELTDKYEVKYLAESALIKRLREASK